MLDANRLFVADQEDRNYILDINTNQWNNLVYFRPLGGGEDAAIGTFFNSTANEIQVAHIRDKIQVYSPRDDLWHSIPWPLSLGYVGITGSKTVQQGPDSFIMVGGEHYPSIQIGDVLHFDENGLKVQNSNILAKPRRNHIAMPIPDGLFTCQ